MEKYKEVMEKALELTGTMREGLDHILASAESGELNHSLHVFNNVLESYVSISSNISLFLDKLPSNKVEEYMDAIQLGFQSLANAYEQGKNDKVIAAIQSTLQPAIHAWYQEMDNAFRPYVIS
jgi:hypothetical protein